MAEVRPLPKLKQQRERMGITRAQLAEELEVSEEDIAAWERDPSKATPAQLADLSVLLWAPWVRRAGEDDDEKLYGALKLEIAGHQLEYPIDQRNRTSVLTQLSERDVQSDEDPGWLVFSTMDNLLVFANPAAIQVIELVSDDAEQPPDFHHPAVYAALEDWELDEEVSPPIGPVVRRVCEAMVEADGDEAFQRTTSIRTISATGRVTSHFIIDEEEVFGVWTLEIQASAFPANRFLPIASEGYHRARFVNLSNMALIEVPLARYQRLVSLGDDAADLDPNNPLMPVHSGISDTARAG